MTRTWGGEAGEVGYHLEEILKANGTRKDSSEAGKDYRTFFESVA